MWVVSLDRSGPLGTGLTAKYTSSRRVSLTADWYADDYWLVDAYVRFSGEALSELLRSTEFSIVANNLLDKAYLSAITENAALARRAADDLDDRDHLVLTVRRRQTPACCHAGTCFSLPVTQRVQRQLPFPFSDN